MGVDVKKIVHSCQSVENMIFLTVLEYIYEINPCIVLKIILLGNHLSF